MLAASWSHSELQQQFEATTGYDPPEIVTLVRSACTPITPACEKYMYYFCSTDNDAFIIPDGWE